MKRQLMLLAASPILALQVQATPSTLYTELDKAMQSWQAEQKPSQENNLSEFEAFKQQHLKDFNRYVETQMAEYDKFRDQLLKSWGDAQVTNQNQFVSYSEDDSARLNVDFENNTLTLSVKHKAGTAPKKHQVEALFQQFLRSEQALLKEFYNNEPSSLDERDFKQADTTKIDKKISSEGIEEGFTRDKETNASSTTSA
jgi:membrane-bound lytic murein transglycosylase C